MDALIYYSAKKRIPYPSELKDICIFLASNWNDWLNSPIVRVTSLDCPVPYEHNLENTVIPYESKIEKAVKEVMGNY